MGSILKTNDAVSLIQRVHSVRTDSLPLWGRLTASQMFYHAASVNEAIAKAEISQRKPRLKQKLLRILVLDILKKMPKGIKSNPEFFSNHSEMSFSKEKERLLGTFELFSDKGLVLGGEHPVFGKLSHSDWGRFVWIHLDHHLRQFRC